MSTIVPNADAVKTLLERADEGPVVMLNLLKFKPRAAGEEGTRQEAFSRYGAVAMKMIEAGGGKVLWAGRPMQVLVGTDADRWDAIALVQHPSPRAFFAMISDAEYQKSHVHREAGVERTVLIACAPLETIGAPR
jgi:uncharacterized protein (DUF1330 family)